MTDKQRLLKRMIVAGINAREVESHRASRLLHDEVGQVLTAVGLQLDVLKLDFRDRVPEITERVHEIQQLVDGAVTQVRALSYDLNPAVVERAGLGRALDGLVGRYRAEFSGNLRLMFDPNVRPPVNVATAMYKIADLAVSNAVRHAHAGNIEILVRFTGHLVILEVKDDGRGFSPEEARRESAGLGLLLMDHYASQVPVRFKLRSNPGESTTVEVRYPPEERKLTQ